MSKYAVFSSVFILLLITSPLTLLAQFDGPPEKGRMRERIEDLRKVKLLDVLDLQGDQVERFFSVYNKHQARFRELQDRIDNSARELQGLIGRGASDAELGEKTNELRKMIRDLEKTIESRFDDVKPTLSAKQFAQYVVFEARFRDELQRMIMDRMKKMRRD